MQIKIGEAEKVFPYPVKSMTAEALDVANLGWRGLDGDRRLASRRVDDSGGFLWLANSLFSRRYEREMRSAGGRDEVAASRCPRGTLHRRHPR